MVSQVERLMVRRQVDAEIKTDPVWIHPERSIFTPDGAGGERRSTPTPIPGDDIEVLIAPAKRRLSEMLVNTEIGEVPQYPYILLARHGADIKPRDEFTWQGEKYEVKSVHIKTEVYLVFQVDYYGGTKNG